MSMAVNAQIDFGEITFGVRAGANFTTITGDLDLSEIGISMSRKMKPGFQLGVVANIPMSNEKITFQPGIIFTQQGAKWKGSGSANWGTPVNLDADVEMLLNYLQIPLNFQYKYDLNGGNTLLFQGGPYLGYGLSGKLKMKVTASALGVSESNSDEESIDFGNDGDFKSLDFGLGLGAGMLFKERIQVGLGYNLGLVDIEGEGEGIKNNGIALTITYIFGK